MYFMTTEHIRLDFIMEANTINHDQTAPSGNYLDAQGRLTLAWTSAKSDQTLNSASYWS